MDIALLLICKKLFVQWPRSTVDPVADPAASAGSCLKEVAGARMFSTISWLVVANQAHPLQLHSASADLSHKDARSSGGASSYKP